MKILAIDTTGLVASVAIVQDDKTVGEFTTNYKKTHSQTLMPMLEQLVKILDININDMDYIACACGPGSFTGLRIGAATAKGLAHGLNKKIIPVPTLDALAYNVSESSHLVVPVMDARRNQVYTALYKDGFKPIDGYSACPIDEILERAAEIDKEAVFLGVGVAVFKDKIIEAGFTLANPSANMQRAACVGALALHRIDEAVDCDNFEILYLRKSQAERELEEKNK